MNVHIPTYSDQHIPLAEKLLTVEMEHWKYEAKRLREMLEGMTQAAVKGEEIFLHHRDKTVKLIPENTALRMSGDIP